MASFETPDPITLDVEIGAGNVLVVADTTATTEIELRPARAGDADALELIEQARVDHHGSTVVVHVPDGRRFGLLRRSPEVVIEARVPAGSGLVVKSKSADVQARGELGNTKIETGSGDVQLADIDGAAVIDSGSGDIQMGTIAGAATVKAASGDIMITTCCGIAKVQTASGDIAITTAEAQLDVRTASGDVSVGEADGPVSARTASGDVSLGTVRGESVTALSASGEIEIGVGAGIAVWLDCSSLSGTVHSSLDAAESQSPDRPTLQIRANTTSGDITIHTA
jgi:DUF4097 and DUF4098 domain-containing protein YvlB